MRRITQTQVCWKPSAFESKATQFVRRLSSLWIASACWHLITQRAANRKDCSLAHLPPGPPLTSPGSSSSSSAPSLPQFGSHHRRFSLDDYLFATTFAIVPLRSIVSTHTHIAVISNVPYAISFPEKRWRVMRQDPDCSRMH